MKSKKFLSGILTIAIVLGTIQFPVLAAEKTGNIGQINGRESVQEKTVLSNENTRASAIESYGTCGDNLTWTLTTDGVLTISGSGEMNDAPAWYDYRDKITTVIIKDGVTSIDYFAFFGYENLTTVVLGNSIEKICGNAFWNCHNLSNITLPSSLQIIEVGAFENCSSLTSITIPSGAIGNSVFAGCSNLKSVTIGRNVSSMGSGTFRDCPNLNRIDVDETNTSYCSQDGILFTKDKTGLVCYPAAKAGESYTVPNGVTAISEDAFHSCSKLTDIILPNSLTQITYAAFSNCESLVNISIPDSVTEIGRFAFGSCTGLESIVIPDTVTAIGADAFSGCSNLKSVDIGNGVTSIGIEAFAYCSNLEKITLGKEIANIKQDAFMECSNLTDVYYAGTEEEWKALGIDLEDVCLDKATIHFNDKSLSAEICNTIIQQIGTADIGDTIAVDMGTATIVPKSVLNALKGKDMNLNMQLSDGTCWIINGQDVQDNVQDLDLSLVRSEKESGLIPAEMMNAISGTADGEQLTFTQEGKFGVNARVAMLTKAGQPDGKKAVLLHYQNEAFELSDSDIVADGKVSFNVGQGSDYAVFYAVNGDVNADEKVNIVDLMRVLHHVSGRTEMNVLQQGIADADLNNNVNIVDLMRMLHYVSGRNSTL